MTTQFKSKRNRVLLAGGQVEKHFSEPGTAPAEYKKLTLLREKGVAVPRAWPPEGRVLRLEYIPGDTIPDFLEAPRSRRELQEAAKGVADWLASFYHAVNHAVTGEIRGDVNGRNFILSNGCVWGVDFESEAYGPPERDMGGLLAFTESYDLEYGRQQSDFQALLRLSFITSLSADPILMEAEREKELDNMRLRRGM